MNTQKNTEGRGRRRISDLDRVIGQNAKALRLGAGMSLEDVGEHLQISYQQVQKYEAGSNRLPLHHIPLLCDLFGVPADLFLQGLLPARGMRVDDDMTRVQACIARVSDQTLRQKIVRVVDILSV
ncbi:MAG: transcriptional regulator, family [Micavibrio sp.]|nr:transcriptional regulator, family [Micavibrio sp.]